MELSRLKGTKDFLPEEQAVRERIKEVILNAFRLYGFRPLETPILELQEILASKYAGGAEILNEIYTLRDQGKRQLALRYDLTVPFSRVMGMNPTLKSPFKRYEIGKVFRDGPVKTGRLREFTQCDADILGVSSMIADAECIAVLCTAFKEMGIDIVVEVNNIKLLKGILETAGVEERLIPGALLSLDKLKKIGEEKVREELKEKGVSESAFDGIFEMLAIEGSPDKILKVLEKKITGVNAEQGLAELKELFFYIDAFKIKKYISLSPELARGLEYYTGTVIEVFMKDKTVTSSLAAGGRYNNMIREFLGKEKEYPTVGISFGLDTIYEGLKNKQEIAPASVYVIPIGTSNECIGIAEELRSAGISVDMDLLRRSLKKNLDYANSLCIPYAILAGQKELEKGKVRLKQMKTGEEYLLSVSEAVKKLKQKE